MTEWKKADDLRLSGADAIFSSFLDDSKDKVVTMPSIYVCGH